jgi:hypothetical protein
MIEHISLNMSKATDTCIDPPVDFAKPCFCCIDSPIVFFKNINETSEKTQTRSNEYRWTCSSPRKRASTHLRSKIDHS